MKKRLLNGSHCALAYLGCLAGHRTTDQAMSDPVLEAYIRRLMCDEVMPLLSDVPGIDLGHYTRLLLQRFANPKITDALQRLARRGSTKVPAYLLPSLLDARRAGRPHDLLTLALAGWIRYLRGTGFDGEPIEIEDAHKAALERLARDGGNDPRPLLGERWIFGALSDDEDFAVRLSGTLQALDRDGVHATIVAHAHQHDLLQASAA
jgi:mannitol-1-phosphate/altronate dehydrogenase